MTQRSQILDAVELGLAGIAVADGYNTDLGDALVYWRPQESEWQQDSLTFRDAHPEGPETFEELNNRVAHRLPIEIEAVRFVPSGENSRSFCEQILQDLLIAIESLKLTVPPATKIDIISATKEFILEGALACHVRLEVMVRYYSADYASTV